MNTILSYATVLILAVVLTAPALVGWLHERRIDRQLAAAEAGKTRRAQKSSSRSTVPSTATWYAEGRRSKKLVSS
ncbi:hypothetical protein [Streptomyces griseosporeus]|uniref:hypothetical protein n=1 Tax=Streptomyces griseosporeus TaxID=1910 RepID=UPI0036FCDFBC